MTNTSDVPTTSVFHPAKVYARSSKFNSPKFAFRNAASHPNGLQTVLHGEDGLFIVPHTNREASILIKAGYERAPFIG